MALLEMYGDRTKASYKRSLEIMVNVMKELEQPCKVPEKLKHAYHTPRPTTFRATLNLKRIAAIENEDDQKLVYAVAVYGHRIMQIYGTRWDSYDKQTGTVRYWASKVTDGVSRAVPF